jgi:hypothetical protein
MFGDSYPRSGLHTITGAVVLAPVKAGDPNPGLFHGLLDKVNSLVGKPVVVVINRSPWAACGKTGVVNYLQSIEETP